MHTDCCERKLLLTPPWWALLLVLSYLPPLSHAGEAQYNLKAVDDYIQPGYAALAARTQQLAQQTAQFCQQPDNAGLQRLQQQYHLAMDSWQFIQPIRLGPIEQSLRSYRLQFWPDKRQSVRRHLTQLLDKADPDSLEAAAFAQGSVAVQGFSALERLIFAPKVSAADFSAAKGGDFRCRLLRAISLNMAEIARQTADQWPAHRQLIATATRGNADYADSIEVSARLFNNLYTQLELMLEQKLRAPLGKSQQRARGKRSESWRSGRSLRNLEQNFAGVEALLDAAFLSRLIDPPLSHELQDKLASCRARLAAIKQPLAEAVADSEQRLRVEALTNTLADLKRTLTGKLASALDLPIGFNSLDGD